MSANDQDLELSSNTSDGRTKRHPSVAVIGGGAAGLSAARTLIKNGVRVIVLEKSDRLGGNCFGVNITTADGSFHTVDAGVSDFNRNTFKELSAVIDELGLQTHPISSDLSVASKAGESLLSCIDGVVKSAPVYFTDVATEMASFRVRCVEAVESKKFAGWTIGQYLDHVGASRALREAFVLPRAMGSFPMPDMPAVQMPMDEIVRFWLIHGIVGKLPADRHVVEGGMFRYVEKLAEALLAAGADIRTNTRVRKVSRGRDDGKVVLEVANNVLSGVLSVDEVIFAVHARSALSLIADDASAEEAFALASFKMQRARVVVHHDAALMPADRDDWGAFNYIADEGPWSTVRPTITFYSNRLAHLPEHVPDTFVTMNPFREPRAGSIASDEYLIHPVAIGGDTPARAAEAIHKLQGKRSSWWAGSYLRSPYVHESAFASGRAAAKMVLEKYGPKGAPDSHDVVITFSDEITGRDGTVKENVFDVTLKLRAPRRLLVRGVRVR